jgi:hypothetical protein
VNAPTLRNLWRAIRYEREAEWMGVRYRLSVSLGGEGGGAVANQWYWFVYSKPQGDPYWSTIRTGGPLMELADAQNGAEDYLRLALARRVTTGEKSDK